MFESVMDKFLYNPEEISLRLRIERDRNPGILEMDVSCSGMLHILTQDLKRFVERVAFHFRGQKSSGYVADNTDDLFKFASHFDGERIDLSLVPGRSFHPVDIESEY